MNILIYCNVGVLVIVGYGIVLGVICFVWWDGRLGKVYVDEICFCF